MESVRDKLAKNIQTYRKQMKLSQKELAAAVGVKNLTTVSSWERGANAPDLETLCKLCDVFKISISDLLDFKYFDSITDLDAVKNEITKADEFQKLFISMYGKEEFDSFMQYSQLTEQAAEKVRTYINDLFMNPNYRVDL